MRSRIAPSFPLAALMLFAALSAPACHKAATDEDTSTEPAPKVVLAVTAARAVVKPTISALRFRRAPPLQPAFNFVSALIKLLYL